MAEAFESYISQLNDRADEISVILDLVNIDDRAADAELPGDRSGCEFHGLDDFFSVERDAGGFIATYQYTVSEDSFAADSSQAFTIDGGYTGDGQVINVFVDGFDGPTTRSNNSFDTIIGNTEVGFRPDLSVGDTFTVSFQINGAGFSANDFDLVLIEGVR